MNILLLSAYDAKSHQYWRKGLVEHISQFNWTVLTLPPRFFNWRIRGNGLYWSQQKQHILAAGYDLIFATSMVDLATLRGLVPELSDTPSILYFHENQFAYPSSDQQYGSIEAQMVSLYSALCASRLVFNSQYNRESFISGLGELLKRLPDYVPSGVCERILRKSDVISVPLMPGVYDCDRQPLSQENGLSIVWNHRWEYDKGPDRLLTFIRKLPEALNIKFHIVGQQFKRCPQEMNEIKGLLESRNWLSSWGFIEFEQDYYSLLRQGDIVLSTSVHDFQGLSILEGMAAGIVPLVPDRLAYRDFVPELFRYKSDLQNIELEAVHAVNKLLELCSSTLNADLATRSVAHLSWSRMKEKYVQIITSTAGIELR